VRWCDYREFFSYAFGGMCGIITVILMHVLINFCSVAVSLFLAFTLTSKFSEDALTELTNEEKAERDAQYNIVLSGIIVVALLSSFIGKFLSNQIFMTINKRLHARVVSRVLATPINFFEENTHGRILNRFSKDVATLDQIVFTFLEMTDYAIKCTFSVAIVIYISPWLVILAAISLVYLVRLRKKCLQCTRDPIRLKYKLMSPVNSLIQDAINGLPTLRCLQ